jgi:hypothetical protein
MLGRNWAKIEETVVKEALWLKDSARKICPTLCPTLRVKIGDFWCESMKKKKC